MKQGSYKQKATYKSGNSKALIDEEDDQIKLGSISKELERELTNSDESDTTKD